MVPEGWVNTKLENYISIRHGYAFKSEFFRESGQSVLLTPGHFFESGGFRALGEKTKFYDGPVPDGYTLIAGDLVVAMTEQAPGLLGSAAVIPLGRTYLHNQRIGLVELLAPERIDKEFLFYIFNSTPARRQISNEAAGTKVRHTSPQKLCNLDILLPPIDEQRRIAEILGTWDRAIEATENLITASEAQKKALMQELLTGKKRLSGFNGAWRSECFEQLFDIKMGGTPSRRTAEYWAEGVGDGHPWVAISDLTDSYIDKTKERITDAGVERSNVKLLPTGTVVFSFKLTIGKRGILRMPAYTNEAICGLLPKRPKQIHSDFLYHALAQMDLEGSVDQAIKGKTLNKQKIAELEFNYPCLEEQKAIVALINCGWQQELNEKEKLQILKTEKDALLQQLLTGKRRVEIKEAAA